MIQRAVFLLLALSIAAQWGCSSRLWADSKETATDTYNYVFDQEPTTQTFHEAAEVPIMEYNYRAADELYSNLDGDELSDESSVFVSRFTNQTDPGDNAVFGYVMTRQVMDRLVQRGVHINEGKPNASDYVYAKDNTAETYAQTGIMDDELPPRSAMLSGTYVIGKNYIYMSAQITRLVDNIVVTAHNWTLPITDNVIQMLPQIKTPDGMEPTVKTSF